MRRRHVAATIAILLLPLTATATSCRVLTLEDHNITHEAGDNTGNIRTAMVGTFLWVQYGNPDNQVDEYENTVSVELTAETIQATVCDDGKITIVEAPAPLSPEAVPSSESSLVGNSAGASTIINLIDIWNDLIVMRGPA